MPYVTRPLYLGSNMAPQLSGAGVTAAVSNTSTLAPTTSGTPMTAPPTRFQFASAQSGLMRTRVPVSASNCRWKARGTEPS